VRSEMTMLPPIAEDADFDTVFEIFRRSPQQSFFPVVDAGGAPRGIIHDRDLKEFTYRPFGRDLLQNKAFKRRLSTFLTPCPTVDINTHAERILEIFAGARASDAVIVTENLAYIGVLSAAALLNVMNEKKIRQAQDQNPLTKLPGNLSISDHVALTALDGDQRRFFCYFDFDDFKPFNDKYGFQHGDRAIRLFAGLMRQHLGAPGIFLGHIGGDDFFASASGHSAAELTQLFSHLLGEFGREVMKLYSEEDQRDRSILGFDRDGRQRRFPIMRCSAAVLELPPHTVTSDLTRIDGLIAKAKSDAKRAKDGIAWQTLVAEVA
jgi:GGDEF domain-containing protein